MRLSVLALGRLMVRVYSHARQRHQSESGRALQIPYGSLTLVEIFLGISSGPAMIDPPPFVSAPKTPSQQRAWSISCHCTSRAQPT